MDRHVVFVHGLRRANSKVWMSSGASPEPWPCWLADDIEKLGIWSVEHDSAPTLWRGHAMPLVDRANNILPRLLAEGRLRKGEISFVVHSFGGLIFEQLLRTASERSTSEPNVADFVSRIRRVTFLGTPHLGADLATWAGKQFKATDALTDLANLVEQLESQKDWPRLIPYARILFERTRDLSACRVFAQALHETGNFNDLVSLLQNQRDLVGQSNYLEALLAWGLYVRAFLVSAPSHTSPQLEGHMSSRRAWFRRALVYCRAVKPGQSQRQTLLFMSLINVRFWG